MSRQPRSLGFALKNPRLFRSKTQIWLGWCLGIALVGLGAIAGWAQTAPSGLAASVEYAKSGQTLELLHPIRQKDSAPITTVRLAGISAPDAQQSPWGEAARSCLDRLVKEADSKTVRLEPTGIGIDQHHRLWARAWVLTQQGNVLLNAAVVRQGCAMVDEDAIAQLPEGQALIYAQEEARVLGLGIWDPAQPLRQSGAAFRDSLAPKPAPTLETE